MKEEEADGNQRVEREGPLGKPGRHRKSGDYRDHGQGRVRPVVGRENAGHRRNCQAEERLARPCAWSAHIPGEASELAAKAIAELVYRLNPAKNQISLIANLLSLSVATGKS